MIWAMLGNFSIRDIAYLLQISTNTVRRYASKKRGRPRINRIRHPEGGYYAHEKNDIVKNVIRKSVRKEIETKKEKKDA